MKSGNVINTLTFPCANSLGLSHRRRPAAPRAAQATQRTFYVSDVERETRRDVTRVVYSVKQASHEPCSQGGKVDLHRLCPHNPTPRFNLSGNFGVL